jgi:fatty acid desaturase
MEEKEEKWPSYNYNEIERIVKENWYESDDELGLYIYESLGIPIRKAMELIRNERQLQKDLPHQKPEGQ